MNLFDENFTKNSKNSNLILVVDLILYYLIINGV